MSRESRATITSRAVAEYRTKPGPDEPRGYWRPPRDPLRDPLSLQIEREARAALIYFGLFAVWLSAIALWVLVRL